MNIKRKLFAYALVISLIICSWDISYADVDLDNPPTEPTRPSAESYKDNNKIEDYNKQAEEYNKKVTEYNASVDEEYNKAKKDIDEYNTKEKERIEKSNSEKQETFDKEMTQYEKDKEQYEKDKEYEARILADPRYDSLEQYNEVVNTYNKKVDTYNDQVSNINKAYGITDEIANNSSQRNANTPQVDIKDTYTIEEAENKSNRKIPVHIEHIFSGTDIVYSIDFEIDANDTITLRGIAPSADIPVENLCYFFYNTDSNHSLGMWSNAISYLYTNTTATTTQGWLNGDTHTITYANSVDEYLQNFDDINITYEYQWLPLYLKKDHVALANTPVEPILPVLDLETFVSLSYPEKRAYLNSISLLSLLPEPHIAEAIQKKNFAPILTVEAAEIKTSSNKNSKNINIINNKTNDKSKVNKIDKIFVPKTIHDINSWALINLISTLLTFILAIILLIMALFNKRKEEDDIEVKNKMLIRIFSVIVAIISGFIFLITEDTTLPMVLVDQWTLLMLIILFVQVVITILCKHKKEEKS